MAHGRRIRPSAHGLLLILMLASLAPLCFGPNLKAGAGPVVGAGSARPREREALSYQDGVVGGGALGIVLGDASVRLNNQPVVPGMAVFKGDVIQTGGTSAAIVNFRSGASATLAESSEVALEWESNTLNLRQGVLVVQGPHQQPTSVHVLGATVIVQGEGEFPAICRIAALGRGAAVFNTRGHVEIYGAGAPFVLPSGKSTRLEAGGPQAPTGSGQAAGQQAGKVSREIPDETLQRGRAAPVTLKVRDVVNWEDLVRTLKNGRVQIALLDGSTLNIGARSEFKVTKHDVTTGQTSIEMTVGKLRADVVKITKPTGSFEVRTQTAVIGVVGTSFMVFATGKNTQVTCLDGLVKVSSINPAIVGSTTLHAGQFTNVARGLAPGGAFQAPPPQVNTQISQTSIGGPSGVPGGAGAGGGGAPGAGAVSSATTAANAGSAAAAAGATGTTVAVGSAASSASSTLSGASGNLTLAAATSSSATSSANSATTSSTTTTTATTTITQTVISPYVPCACQ